MTVVDINREKESSMLAGIDDPKLRERALRGQAYLVEKYNQLGTWGRVNAHIGGGFKDAYFNSFATGSFNGNVETALELIERARELDDDRAKNVFQIEFVDTTIARSIRSAIRQTRARGELGLLAGDSGIGKSTTIAQYCTKDKSILLYRANPTFRGGIHPVLLQLVSIATKTQEIKRMSASALYSVLADEMRRRFKLAIFDEAQCFSRDMLDVLRILAEDSGVPILFSGNNQVYEGTFANGMPAAAFTQFKSRCLVNKQIQTIDIQPSDVAMIARQLLTDDTLSEVSSALVGVARSEGGFRSLRGVLQRAHEKAKGGSPTPAQVLDAIESSKPKARRGGAA